MTHTDLTALVEGTSVRPLAGGDSAFQHGGWKSFEAQTGPTGTVTGTREYDAFGAQLGSTGAWQGGLSHGGGYGYQSDDTGLQLLGHRYYDPSTGRFLTRDPIKDGPNWYAYCLNDPVNRMDPTGLSSGHGNSRASSRVCYLYFLIDSDGNFLKWGVTQGNRYSMPWLNGGNPTGRPVGIVIVRSGSRAAMLKLERLLEEIAGGPWNRTKWSGGTPPTSADDAWKIVNEVDSQGRPGGGRAGRGGGSGGLRGGGRGTGSGGAMGGLGTVAEGAGAFAQGAGPVINWRRETQDHLEADPYVNGDDGLGEKWGHND